jgi:hypothetical protein
MFGRFLPKETSFFDFFEQHAALTVEGTKEFLSLVTTGANIETKARRISRHRARDRRHHPPVRRGAAQDVHHARSTATTSTA